MAQGFRAADAPSSGGKNRREKSWNKRWSGESDSLAGSKNAGLHSLHGALACQQLGSTVQSTKTQSALLCFVGPKIAQRGGIWRSGRALQTQRARSLTAQMHCSISGAHSSLDTVLSWDLNCPWHASARLTLTPYFTRMLLTCLTAARIILFSWFFGTSVLPNLMRGKTVMKKGIWSANAMPPPRTRSLQCDVVVAGMSVKAVLTWGVAALRVALNSLCDGDSTPWEITGHVCTCHSCAAVSIRATIPAATNTFQQLSVVENFNC